jgi:hypothetical protein
MFCIIPIFTPDKSLQFLIIFSYFCKVYSYIICFLWSLHSYRLHSRLPHPETNQSRPNTFGGHGIKNKDFQSSQMYFFFFGFYNKIMTTNYLTIYLDVHQELWFLLSHHGTLASMMPRCGYDTGTGIGYDNFRKIKVRIRLYNFF